MKKKLASLLLAACIAISAGCGSAATATANKPLSNAVYNDDSVSLAEYTGLKAEKKNYIVTQEAVDSAISEAVLDYAEYKAVSRASKTGDYVCMDYTALADGTEAETEEDYYLPLGEEDFGAQFDEKLTGVSAGDKLSFSLDFEKDFYNEAFAGKTVQFEIYIRTIRIQVLPKLTDAFVKENLGYDTYKAFADDVRKSVAQAYEAESTDELQESLLRQVIDASSILQYSKEEYEEASQSVKSSYLDYAETFGKELEEIYELFDVTDDSLEDEILQELYRMIVVKAIIQNEGFALSGKEYEDGIAYYMEQNEYTSKQEFVSDYGKEEIQNRLLEDKVLKYLEDSADITQVDADYEAEAE